MKLGGFIILVNKSVVAPVLLELFKVGCVTSHWTTLV